MPKLPKKCLGYDENGKSFDCPNEAGTPWSPLWCSTCDERRRTRITAQLEELRRGFDRGGQA